jgi:hypothetical protein
MRCKGHERHNSSWRSVEWRTSRSAETSRPSGNRRAYPAQEWTTKDDSDAENSEYSYYVPDDYHSDDSGYDSDMYKKCWEDDF